MLNRKECEEACLYLLLHCYETDAPALENGEKDKVYKFTPSGFKENEIFKQLIEEHFDNQLTYEEVDLLIDLVKPHEDELGSDISLLLFRLRHMKDMLPKGKGVVESVEWDD